MVLCLAYQCTSKWAEVKQSMYGHLNKTFRKAGRLIGLINRITYYTYRQCLSFWWGGGCPSVWGMPEVIVPPDSLSLPFPVDLGPMVVLLQVTKLVSAAEDMIYPPWITLLCHKNISSKIFRQRIIYVYIYKYIYLYFKMIIARSGYWTLRNICWWLVGWPQHNKGWF